METIKPVSVILVDCIQRRDLSAKEVKISNFSKLKMNSSREKKSPRKAKLIEMMPMPPMPERKKKFFTTSSISDPDKKLDNVSTKRFYGTKYSDQKYSFEDEYKKHLNNNTFREYPSKKKLLTKIDLDKYFTNETDRPIVDYKSNKKQEKDQTKVSSGLLNQSSLKKEKSKPLCLRKTRFVNQNENCTENSTELPELTEAMMDHVESVLVLATSNDMIIEKFGLTIRKKDLETLEDLNWLNSEVINFYMNLIMERGTKENYPSVHAMNTYFYTKLLFEGYESVKRWTRKIDIFSKEIIFIPIYIASHWSLAVIDFRDISIKYYDSMGSSNKKCLTTLKQYLQDEHLNKKEEEFNSNGWSYESVCNIPRQKNGSDCGAFVCTYAEYISANKVFNFSQKDMPYFRKKIEYEIISVTLL